MADDLDAEKLRGYILRHESGLSILPAPLRPEEGEAIDATRIAGILQTARAMFDAIVVDTAPLFDGPMLTALDRSDQLLLVSTPDVPSMKNIRLALQTLELLGFPIERVALVANRVGMARRRVGGGDGRHDRQGDPLRPAGGRLGPEEHQLRHSTGRPRSARPFLAGRARTSSTHSSGVPWPSPCVDGSCSFD